MAAKDITRRTFLRGLLTAPIAVPAAVAAVKRPSCPSFMIVPGKPGLIYVPSMGKTFRITVREFDGTFSDISR